MFSRHCLSRVLTLCEVVGYVLLVGYVFSRVEHLNTSKTSASTRLSMDMLHLFHVSRPLPRTELRMQVEKLHEMCCKHFRVKFVACLHIPRRSRQNMHGFAEWKEPDSAPNK